MSSIPSIRVECAQCKKSFWVKLKKGTIPNVAVACPNCAYAWDLSKLSSDSIVHRSYKWDEFLKKVTLLLQPRKRVEDVSEEAFREAGDSGDSTERAIKDLPDLVLEPVTKVSELGPTSSEAIREPNSGSIRRPDNKHQSVELAHQSLSTPSQAAPSPPPVKPKETARYPSIPTSPMASGLPVAKRPTSEDAVSDDKEPS